VRIGIPLSALAHVGVIWLAVWGLPWLRVRPQPPEPAVVVTLVSPAELAALSRGRPAPEAPPVEVAPPAQPVPERTFPEPEPEPGPEPEIPEPPDLRPEFDAGAPLGIEGPVRLDRSEVEREATGSAGVDAATAGNVAGMAGFEASVREAISRAQIYPRAALDRGITGSLRLRVRVSREGRVLGAGVVRSSGAVVLDRAALEAARRARVPAAPAGLEGEVFEFEVRLVFALGG
jgi:periplasmic protein TonB